MVTLRYDERPWTANTARAAKHWSVVSRLTAQWRAAFSILAQHQRIGQLGPSIITVTPYLRDGRGSHDVGGCFPAAKAAIDGLVDAGVWPDDDPTWVVELRFLPPVRGQGDALELTIEPAVMPLGGPHLHTR